MNIDVTDWHGVQPDMVADVFSLPETLNDLEAVYCGHFLEHIQEHRVVEALQNLLHRMAPQAIICVVGPDVHRAYDLYLRGLLDENTYKRAHKSPPDWNPEWEGDTHYWDCHEQAVIDYMQRAGFKSVRPLQMNSAELDQFPVTARVGWQCAVIGEA